MLENSEPLHCVLIFLWQKLLKEGVNMESRKYFIGEVSKLTGASPKSIRNWERFIGKVDRLVCGRMSYRYYTDRQLELIKLIKKNLDEGYRLDHAAEKALQKLSN